VTVLEKDLSRLCISSFILSGDFAFTAVYSANFVPSYTPNLISKGRMCEAIDVILSLQNPNGGFASYELIRGPSWLEQLNPAEVFG
jgi:lanosterol synthase